MDQELQAVRQEYEAAFGKKAFHGWDAATLKQKIADGLPPQPPPEPPAPPPPDPPAKDGVQVMLLCKSVFLPKDLLTAAWQSADTAKYPGEVNNRRARLTVHPSLAEFLQDRKQAEIL